MRSAAQRLSVFSISGHPTDDSGRADDDEGGDCDGVHCFLLNGWYTDIVSKSGGLLTEKCGQMRPHFLSNLRPLAEIL